MSPTEQNLVRELVRRRIARPEQVRAVLEEGEGPVRRRLLTSGLVGQETLQALEEDLRGDGSGGDARTVQVDSGAVSPAGGGVRSADAPIDSERYRVGAEIARGGMGVVYRARQVDLDRPVAIKVLLAGAEATPEEIRRFHAEADALARVSHPNLVDIYEFRRDATPPWFAMEFVEGPTLREVVVREGPLPPGEAVGLVRPVAEALLAVHEADLLHRDIKPDNIMIRPDGSPVLMDFGLVRSGDSRLTTTGTMLGTPRYMAPEQIDGDPEAIDERADIYGLAAVLYFLVTGRPPYEGDSIYGVVKQKALEDPVPPREIDPDVPGDLDRLIRRSLSRHPRPRPSTTGDLVRALDRLGTAGSGRPEELPPWTLKLVGGVAALAVAVVLWVVGSAVTSPGVVPESTVRNGEDGPDGSEVARVPEAAADPSAPEPEGDAGPDPNDRLLAALALRDEGASPDRVRAALREVVDAHPDSRAAEIAHGELDRLDRPEEEVADAADPPTDGSTEEDPSPGSDPATATDAEASASGSAAGEGESDDAGPGEDEGSEAEAEADAETETEFEFGTASGDGPFDEGEDGGPTDEEGAEEVAGEGEELTFPPVDDRDLPPDPAERTRAQLWEDGIVVLGPRFGEVVEEDVKEGYRLLLERKARARDARRGRLLRWLRQFEDALLSVYADELRRHARARRGAARAPVYSIDVLLGMEGVPDDHRRDLEELREDLLRREGEAVERELGMIRELVERRRWRRAIGQGRQLMQEFRPHLTRERQDRFDQGREELAERMRRMRHGR